ncbi:hypothetical protein LTR17_009229 [Elasticomyces elasticus]|nr:hypothetical protein LTR17_009229 [Elasticomyces elasticus]
MTDRDRHWVFDYEHHAVIQRVARYAARPGFTKLQDDIRDVFVPEREAEPASGYDPDEWEWHVRDMVSRAARHANVLWTTTSISTSLRLLPELVLP